MKLGQYIKILEGMNPEKTVSNGLCNPHCWRGDYSEVSFEPVGPIKVKTMLSEAKRALDGEFTEWKGGEYTFDEETSIHIDFEGSFSDGNEIFNVLFGYMFKDL